MRKFVLLLAMVSIIALAGYVPLSAGVKAGPIVVSSIKGNNVYAIVTPDDGNLAMYNIAEIGELSTSEWKNDPKIDNVSGDGIPSTGGHAYGLLKDTSSSTPLNAFAVAARGVGLYLAGFDSSAATGSVKDSGDWKNMVGGIAVFKAAEPDTSKIYFGVAGVSMNGKLIASIYSYDGSDFTDLASDTDDTGENAYSSIAVDANVDASNAKLYFGTDEGFYVYKLEWNIGSTSIATLTREKSFSVPGKVQSGIAMDNSNVYFLSYGLDNVYFNVYPKGGSTIRTYTIPIEPGYSPDGYPTNSPVVVNNGTSKRVFIAIGRAVYYYDTDTFKIEKWADIGEPIYAAPIVLNDKDNTENYILVVVTANGNVYRVEKDNASLISSECAGHGDVFSPPAARGGWLVFGVSTYDGKGELCSVDISSFSIGASTKDPWPAFGYADGRTQTFMYNPPFKIPIFLKAFIQNGDSLDKVGVYATYTTSEMTDFATAIYNDVINVPYNGAATVVAVDYATDLWDVVPGDDASYVFDKWTDTTEDATNPVRYATPITEYMNYTASYNLYYKIYLEIRDPNNNIVDGGTATEWATAFENFTLNSTSTFVLDHWEVYVEGSSTPTMVSTDDILTVNVNEPLYIKEYIKRVYGQVEFKYQKYLMEPATPANQFMVSLKVTKLSTENAGSDASPIKAFDLKLDLSSLPFGVGLAAATYEVNLDYPTNVSATTTKQLFERIGAEGDNMVEYILVLSTPVSTASDIFMATLTFQYSGEGFPMEADKVFNKDMVTMKVGGEDIKEGIAKVLTSYSLDLDGYEDAYIPEYLGYTSILGDFDVSGCVDIFDFMALVNHYNLTDQDPGWDPIYDIGPRSGADLPATPGCLIAQTPRKVDFSDLLIEAVMYGQGCE